MKFFSPTNIYKELMLLQEIEKKPNSTQKDLASIIGAAASMVNVYINELEEKGYLKREYISAKTVNYHITPQGIKRKNYLLITYMRELLDLYRLAKNGVGEFLTELQYKGYKNILLYGAGEVAETIIGVIRDKEYSSLNVVAIVDDDENKQGKEFMGYKVIPSEDIMKCDHDAIVITSYTFEEDIDKKLIELDYPMDRVVKFFGVDQNVGQG